MKIVEKQKYFIIETESTHRIKYLVSGSQNLKVHEAYNLIRSADNPIELIQEWVGETPVSLMILSENQEKEMGLPSLNEEEDEKDFIL